MDVGEFCALIVERERKIVSAIQSGSQWEVWLQVELFTAIVGIDGCSVGREVRFGGRKPVDLAFTSNCKTYFVELKIESAHNAGQFAGKSLPIAVGEDSTKLHNLQAHADHKWVCCVAWSPDGKEAMGSFGFDYIQYGDTISVALKKI